VRKLVAVLALLIVLIPSSVGAGAGTLSSKSRLMDHSGVYEFLLHEGVSSGDSPWYRLEGQYYCKIYLTTSTGDTVDVAWPNGSSVDLEILDEGTTDTPVKWSNVAVSGLVGVTQDSDWYNLSVYGYVRIEVTGTDVVDFQCRQWDRR